MKHKTKKLFFTYIGVSVLAIIAPITIACGTNYHTNKIANSKQMNTTINKVQKVPNFVNANLFQNTDYGTTKITIGKNNTWGSIENSSSSALNSFWNQLNLNLSNSSLIPENIDWTSSTLTNNTNINGALEVWIQSYCSPGATNKAFPPYGNSNMICSEGNISNWVVYNFQNNKLTYQINNFYINGSTPWWFTPYGTNNAPLNLEGEISFNGINSNGNITFTSNNQTSIFPASTAASMQGMNTDQYWPNNSISNPEFQFGTNSTWIITLPFNMQKIQSNIQSAISSISLKYYEFQQQWETGLVNQIDQDIKGCIPSYMSNCFNINPLDSTINYGNGTSGTITTTLDYTGPQNQTVTWTFTTNITAPAQPSNTNAYNSFNKIFSQPITLFSDTSNVWDSNKYWNNSTVPSTITNPKVWSYIESNDQIYYNGLANNTTLTWCTNKTVLKNYINTIFNMTLNELQHDATVANPDPFINNPISIQSISFINKNNTNYIKTELTFNNGNFNKVKYINNDTNPSPWVFYTPVTLSLTQYYYSVNIMSRISIQASNMPIASSFKTVADNGYFIQGSNSTASSSSNNGSGFINAGTYLYYSTATLTFTGTTNEEDTLEVNNQPISVINNQFTYTLAAPSVFNTSSDSTQNNNDNSSVNNNSSISKTYNIEIYKNNVPIFEETIVITRGVPNVNFKWYAWNPSAKPWQEKLISQNLSNGKANPQYNPLINANTGSINQILWVNQPTPNSEPYFDDPYDSNNQRYNTNETVPPNDIGYIADAQVFNKGVSINWNTENADVYRQGLIVENGKLIPSNNPTDNPAFNGFGARQEIQPNNNNNVSYFSYSGLWEYTAVTLYDGNNYLPQNTGIYSYYLIDVINSNNEQQINKFTNVVKTSSVVPFWTSYHGIHLANYLKTNENMSSSQIQSLTYAQVQYWWNNYCSSNLAQTINNDQTFNLANCPLNEISLNNSNIAQIQNIIDTDIENALSVYNLLNTKDYEINITQQQLENLANYQNDPDGQYQTNITVTSINNLACNGTLNIKVINSINNLNLNDIVFGQIDLGIVGNSETDITTLKNNIINQVQLQINNYCLALNIKTKFTYNVNWAIDWNYINNLLLTNNKHVALQYIKVYAIANTNCSGYNEVLVENNVQFTNSNNFLNLGYLAIPNLMMNLTNTDLNFLIIEISNYIFLDINQAFNAYFNTHKLNPSIENELNYSWVNNKNYNANEMQYPSTFNKYWTINNYANLINELVNNINNKSFNNEVTFFITPTTNGSKNLYGAIPFVVDNSNLNKLGVTNSNKYYYPNIYNSKDNSGDQYNPYATNSSNKKSNDNNKTHNSLPEWVIPVAVICILIGALIITAIYQRIKNRNYI